MERARTEWLRALGFEQPALKTDLGIIFVVHSMALIFKSPAYFNDLLEVRARLLKIGHGSMEFSQSVTREDNLLVEATVKLACVDAVSFKPIGIPAIIKQAIKNME